MSSLSLRMPHNFSSPFIRHHQPSLSWLTRCPASSSAARGKACLSSVLTSAPQLFVALHSASPTLTQLADKVSCQFFRGQGQGLPFIRTHICAHEKARGPNSVRGTCDCLTVP